LINAADNACHPGENHLYCEISLSARQVKIPAGTDFFLFHRSLTPLLSVVPSEIAVATRLATVHRCRSTIATAVLVAGHQFGPAALACKLLPLRLVQIRYTQMAAPRALTCFFAVTARRTAAAIPIVLKYLRAPQDKESP
jgi:hypothetical protein